MTSDSEHREHGLRGRLGRLLWRDHTARRVPRVEDSDLVVVAECDDDAAASSTVLAAAGFDSADPVVLRHLLAVPADQTEAALGSAALDGYVESVGVADGSVHAPLVTLALARVQEVDARRLSQERSRMTSVASRCGGLILGWTLLDVPVPPAVQRR